MPLRCRSLFACVFAIAGCSSFDDSLLDYAGNAPPRDQGSVHDAGAHATPSEPDVHVMDVPDATVMRDRDASGGFDAGHMHVQPPPPAEDDAGSDDDAGAAPRANRRS